MTKQTEIPGCENPKDPDIERDLDAWLAATDAAKSAADDKKLRHTLLIARVMAAGLTVYPYVCARTGKKKRLRVDVSSKIKTERDPMGRRKRQEQDADLSPGERAEREAAKLEAKAAAQANTVESRRVRREDVPEADYDPFAATRAAMKDGVH